MKTATAKTANGTKTAKAWFQPVCGQCWSKLKLKTGRPQKGNEFRDEACCFCNDGLDTDERYLIRINPGTVPYSSRERDEPITRR